MQKFPVVRISCLVLSTALIFGCQQVNKKYEKVVPKNEAREEIREEVGTRTSATPEVMKCGTSTCVPGAGTIHSEKAKALLPDGANPPPIQTQQKKVSGATSALPEEEDRATAQLEIDDFCIELEEMI